MIKTAFLNFLTQSRLTMVLSEITNVKKLTFFLFLLFISNLIVISSSMESEGVKCIDRERVALLKFQAELIDDYGRLSTWGTGYNKRECCKWTGIRCDNQTNHVVSLDLQGPLDENLSDSKPLRGKLSPSLLELVDITFLDLSNNDFNTTIPNFIGSFQKLQHLNLSFSNFFGSIPPHLGNLSMLRNLDLTATRQFYVLSAEDLDWLSGFHSLQHLDLSGVDLEKVVTWLKPISKLTQLKKLYMGSCGIQDILLNSSFPISNKSNSLMVLDLSFNHNLKISTLSWFLNFSHNYIYIDFSDNYHMKGEIPEELTELTSLSYLDLNSCNLEGSIPDTLGNMKSLAYLDLSWNYLQGNIPDSMGKLTSISYLSLAFNNLQGGFPHSTGNLSKLVTLELLGNKLETDLKYMNEFLMRSTLLEHLDLSDNRFYGSIPQLSKFPFLNTLNLRGNHLNGSFTDRKLRLPRLTSSDVSSNQLTGNLPNLASCSSLAFLSMSGNKFNGTLTTTFGNLSKLLELDLRSNELEGVISEAHPVFNLSTLYSLDLSLNSNLTIRISSDWNPTFQLNALRLANCNIGPSFPKWLQNQTKMMHLDISNSQINDNVPGWFWNNSHMLDSLNMSFNHISGVLPNVVLSNSSFLSMDLRSNEFNGPLPRLSFSGYVDLSRNKFSGEITEFCNGMYGLTHLDLSYNRLSGELSKECFTNLMMTRAYLNLGSNNFSGEIIPSLNNSNCVLSSLHLGNNNFRGQLPMSLGDCPELVILDIGNNYFSGNIPTWIGENLSIIGVVSLRSNKFTGVLPSSLCLLANIQILDISMNDISGTIPRCLNNFTRMRTKPTKPSSLEFSSTTNVSFFDSAYLMWKGHDTEYANTHTLWQVKAIDLSSNNLVGQIPTEITSLEGLIALNLSGNRLMGSIPRDIDKLEFLNFLDMSHNNLSGSIPTTLSQLNHLGMMDLSFNNLSGKIPWNTHLETFGSNAFLGNPQLCGPPLSKPCPEDQIPKIPKSTSSEGHLVQDEDMYITTGFFISMAIGFTLAFWGIFGILTFNKSCSIKFSKLLTAFGDWWYVNKSALQKYFKNQ